MADYFSKGTNPSIKMDFPHFGPWMPSPAVDGWLQCPPQMANDARLVHNSSTHSEFPPQKRPRSGEEASHLRNPGARSNDISRSVCNNMDHDHHLKLGISGNYGHRDDKRFPDSKVENGINLCRYVFRGEKCPYAERCHFLHERSGKFEENSVTRTSHERWEKDEGKLGTVKSYAISVDRSGSRSSSLDAEGCRNSRCPWWKTRLCNKWGMYGACPYGMRCIFAHGQAELRQNYDSAASVFSSKDIVIARTDEGKMNCETRVGRDQVLENKCSFKWERLRKTVGIYADWISDESIRTV